MKAENTELGSLIGEGEYHIYWDEELQTFKARASSFGLCTKAIADALEGREYFRQLPHWIHTAALRGIVSEPWIIETTESLYGLEHVDEFDQSDLFVNIDFVQGTKTWPVLITGTPDAIAKDPEGRHYVIEAKTSAGNLDSPPQQYFIQLGLYMMMLDSVESDDADYTKPSGILTLLDTADYKRLRHYHLEYAEARDIVDQYLKAVHNTLSLPPETRHCTSEWNSCVCEGGRVRTTQRRHLTVEDLDARTLTLLDKVVYLRKQRDHLDVEYERVKEELKKVFPKQAELETDAVICRYYTYTQRQLDSRMLKSDKPDIYEQYTHEVERNVFEIKPKY